MISAKSLNSHLLDIHIAKFYIIKHARDICMEKILALSANWKVCNKKTKSPRPVL